MAYSNGEDTLEATPLPVVKLSKIRTIILEIMYVVVDYRIRVMWSTTKFDLSFKTVQCFRFGTHSGGNQHEL